MAAPKIKIPYSTKEQLLQAAGISFLLLMIGLTLYYYDSLPNRIPSHFNAAGEPDAWAG